MQKYKKSHTPIHRHSTFFAEKLSFYYFCSWKRLAHQIINRTSSLHMLKSVTKKAIFLFIPILCLSADAFPTGINSVSLAETDITVKASTPENPDPVNPVGPVITYPESMKCGTVPTIYINTENYVPIIDKETKIPASLYIDSSMSEKFENLGTAESPLELTIKGRGNASWLYHKKPYKIKFEKKQAPLGLTKSKHFALLPEVNVRAIT